jgi:hypothetical protein
MRMRHIVIFGLPRSTNISLLSHARHDFQKTLMNIKCVFRVSLYNSCKKAFILRRTEWDMIESVYWSSCKITVILVACFLLGNSPASEFYMPTFRNTLFHLHRQVGKLWLNLRMVGVSIWERVWLKSSLSQLEGGWWGRGGSVYKAGSEILMTHMEVAGVYVKQIWLVSGWAKGWQVKTIVL